MYVNGEWFWALGEFERDEAYILADTSCLLCGESLEGESFIQWYFHGPRLDLAGMHVSCAQTMCLGMLKDLAAGGALDVNPLQQVVAAFTAQAAPAPGQEKRQR